MEAGRWGGRKVSLSPSLPPSLPLTRSLALSLSRSLALSLSRSLALSLSGARAGPPLLILHPTSRSRRGLTS